VLIIRRSKLYYTAFFIVTPVGGRPVHRFTVFSQLTDTKCWCCPNPNRSSLWGFRIGARKKSFLLEKRSCIAPYFVSDLSNEMSPSISRVRYFNMKISNFETSANTHPARQRHISENRNPLALPYLHSPEIPPLNLLLRVMKMCMVHWWNDTGREELSYSASKYFQCHCVQHKSHEEWLEIEHGPPRWEAHD